MTSRNLPLDTKVFMAIERLLCTSGRESWALVSVVDEASRFCYKTVSGEIGTVDRSFIMDRVNGGLL